MIGTSWTESTPIINIHPRQIKMEQKRREKIFANLPPPIFIPTIQANVNVTMIPEIFKGDLNWARVPQKLLYSTRLNKTACFKRNNKKIFLETPHFPFVNYRLNCSSYNPQIKKRDISFFIFLDKIPHVSY